MKEITLRSAGIGEYVARKIAGWNDAFTLNRERRVILLVHGFNVTEEEARESFYRHERLLNLALGPSHRGRLGTLCALHWPGDHPNRIVSAASFPVRVPVSRTCGERLAAFLGTLRADLQIVLVSHSLGGQLVLEALDRIREARDEGLYQGPKVTHAFLLAPAVAVEECMPEAHWGRRNCEEHVFYSERDAVLKLLFRPGMDIYVPVGGEAVGERGAPITNRWSHRHPTTLGHSQYWDDYAVAALITKSLLGRVGRNHLPERQLDSGRGDPTLGAVRHLPSRPLANREMGSNI